MGASLEPVSRTELRLGLGSVTTSGLGARGKTKIYALPLLFFNYRDIVDLDEAELRINLVSDGIFQGSALSSSGFRAGPTLKVEFGRRAFGSGVTGPGKVGTSVEIGGFASYSFGPARARVRVRQDIAAGHGGALAEFDIRSGLYRKNGLTIAVQLASSWASRRYMQSFFGVKPAAGHCGHRCLYASCKLQGRARRLGRRIQPLTAMGARRQLAICAPDRRRPAQPYCGGAQLIQPPQ